MIRRMVPVFLTIVFMVGCSAPDLTRSHLARLERADLPSFEPPKVHDEVLASGARVFVLEDRALPIVTIEAFVRAGSIYEPSERLGTAALTAMMLRDGGTGSLAPSEVDRIIDDTASRIGFSADRELMTGSLKIMASKRDDMLPVFFDLMLRSRFDPERLKLNKLKLIEAIKRQNDDPEEVAARDFRKMVYGEASPWARTPEIEDIERLTIEDAASFGRRFIQPSAMFIAIAGDIDRETIVKTLAALTTLEDPTEPELPTVAPVAHEFDAATRHVERDVNQAYIYMGHLGIKRHNPDKYALQVMNTILGGASFKSRLMEDIRTERGLAYNVWSHFGWGTDYGLFRIFAATKAQNQEQVVGLIRDEVQRLASTGEVSAEELSYAKNVVLGGLIFEFDNSFKIALSQAQYLFYGYPPDYWKRYRTRISRVDREDVRAVARRHLHPDGLKVLILGPDPAQPAP